MRFFEFQLFGLFQNLVQDHHGTPPHREVKVLQAVVQDLDHFQDLTQLFIRSLLHIPVLQQLQKKKERATKKFHVVWIVSFGFRLKLLKKR